MFLASCQNDHQVCSPPLCSLQRSLSAQYGPELCDYCPYYWFSLVQKLLSLDWPASLPHTSQRFFIRRCSLPTAIRTSNDLACLHCDFLVIFVVGSVLMVWWCWCVSSPARRLPAASIPGLFCRVWRTSRASYCPTPSIAMLVVECLSPRWLKRQSPHLLCSLWSFVNQAPPRA